MAYRAKESFTAWGRAYAPGDPVNPADWNVTDAIRAEALANRLAGGDVDEVPDEPKNAKPDKK